MVLPVDRPVPPVPHLVGTTPAWLALAVFAVLLAAYGGKALRHPQAVRAEWRHPVKLAFVPTGSIALVILALALLESQPTVSAGLWGAGATAQFALTLDVLRTWIADPRFTLDQVHPAWFIPVVGNLVVPLAGVSHAPAQLAWYSFAVGLVYWLGLLPLVLGRLVLGGALPGKLAPTLAVLVAPPAVAALSWVRLGGRWTDPVAQILLDVRAGTERGVTAFPAGRSPRAGRRRSAGRQSAHDDGEDGEDAGTEPGVADAEASLPGEEQDRGGRCQREGVRPRRQREREPTKGAGLDGEQRHLEYRDRRDGDGASRPSHRGRAGTVHVAVSPSRCASPNVSSMSATSAMPPCSGADARRIRAPNTLAAAMVAQGEHPRSRRRPAPGSGT